MHCVVNKNHLNAGGTPNTIVAAIFADKLANMLAVILTVIVAAGALFASDAMANTNPEFGEDARAQVTQLQAVIGAEAIDANELSDKPVIVTFFASWCPPCREEFQHLNEVAVQFQDTDLRIVAINVHEAWDENDAERMEKFITDTNPIFPAVVGSPDIRELFNGIDRIPTVYGFNKQGELSYRFIHKRNAKKTNASFDELKNAALTLLQETK